MSLTPPPFTNAVERSYVADIIPDPNKDDMPIEFIVAYNPSHSDQPWMVSSDITCDTHHTLDQVLFWELIVGERHISEHLRRQIIEDFKETSEH